MLPGFEYFCDQFAGILSNAVAAFKAAQLFLPQKVLLLQPVASTVDTLCTFPFLDDDNLIDGMRLELATCLAAATGVNPEFNINPLSWWKQQSDSELSNWVNAVSKVVFIQPSSAAAERAFSIRNNSFGANQDSALADYVEVSLMLQYINR